MGLFRFLWNVISGKPRGMANPDAIDLVATDRRNGKLLLIMTEHRPWDGESMRQQFRAKTNAYVQYVLSEQFPVDRPGVTPQDVVIKLDCASTPDKDTLSLFDEVKAELSQHGIGFAYEVC